jgi:hypothetical protein
MQRKTALGPRGEAFGLEALAPASRPLCDLVTSAPQVAAARSL